MNRINNVLRIVALIVLLIAHKSIAQTSSALDAKNGFRDAKFGMPLSDFKNMVVSEMGEYSNGFSSYNRTTDSNSIGDAKIRKIDYRFYNNRLFEISFFVYKNDFSVFQAFKQAYGPSRPFTRAEDQFEFDLRKSTAPGDIYGRIWEGANVRINVWSASFAKDLSRFQDCSVSIKSKKMLAEIQRQTVKRRAADL